MQQYLRVMPFPGKDLTESLGKRGIIFWSSKNAVFQVLFRKGEYVKEHEDDSSIVGIGYFRIQHYKYGLACM